jgi:hypothetical protein
MMQRKIYSRPTLKKLTPEQAQQLIADRKSLSAKEAAEFLKSLPRQPQNEPTWNEQIPTHSMNEQGKRSA